MKFFIVIFLAITNISCTKQATVRKNELHLALGSKIDTLDPALAYDTVSAKIIYQVYEQLFEYEYLKRPFQLRPLLAVNLPTVSEDRKTYRIQIKKNILYHPSPFLKKGRTVKAQDFIMAMKRLAYAPLNSPGFWAFDGMIIGINDFRQRAKSIDDLIKLPVNGLRAIDDYTLEIKLTRPYRQLDFILAMSFCSPVPAEALNKVNNDLSDTSIGTGPFIIKERIRNSKITLVRNSNYHKASYPKYGDRIAHEREFLKDAGKELPFVDKITFSIMKEAQTRWLNFMSGKIDNLVLGKDHFALALNSAGNLREELVKKGIQNQLAPTLTYWWLAFNMQDKVVGKNKLLRKAIAYALDKDDMINIFTNNISLKAGSIIPPGVQGHNASAWASHQYNIKKAKELLAQAGYSAKNPVPPIQFDLRGNSTLNRQQGEFIQAQLAKIGISIKINLNTFPGFLRKLRQGQLQMWVGGWSMDYPDAENSIALLISKNLPPGNNYTAFSDPIVDKAYQVLVGLDDRYERLQAIDKVQKIIDEELPWIMLYYERKYVLNWPWVKNYRFSDIIYNNLKYIRVQ